MTRLGAVEDALAKMALHSGAMLAALVITWQIIRPLQVQVAPVMSPLMPLVVYLPFGIKVLSAYFDGFRSILYLMPGALLANQFFFHQPWDTPGTWLAILASYGSAPAVFLVMDWAALSDRPRAGLHPRAWRVVLVGGAVASLLGASLVHVIKQGRIPDGQAMTSLMTYALGDMLGLVVTMALLMWLFRLARLAGR